MIEWASGDVTSLFDLHAAQVKRVNGSHSLKAECDAKSESNANFLREKIVKPERINGRNIGKFIGRGDNNNVYYTGIYNIKMLLNNLDSCI